MRRGARGKSPVATTAHALIAAAYGHLGRIAEGRAAWEQVLRLEPGYSIERQRRILPFRNPADFESRVEGLRSHIVDDVLRIVRDVHRDLRIVGRRTRAGGTR